MADDNETTKQALGVMTRSFCEWVEWAFKVSGFETDDSAALREGIEEKIRTAERRGYMMALEKLRAAHSRVVISKTVIDEIAAQAPGEPTPS